jgi:hypothetical protein
MDYRRGVAKCWNIATLLVLFTYTCNVFFGRYTITTLFQFRITALQANIHLSKLSLDLYPCFYRVTCAKRMPLSLTSGCLITDIQLSASETRIS